MSLTKREKKRRDKGGWVNMTDVFKGNGKSWVHENSRMLDIDRKREELAERKDFNERYYDELYGN